jgi:hypothetical protein
LIRLTLKIRPVKLNKSIYVRVPNDIADLIGVDGQTDVTLRLQDAGDEFFLIYAVRKAMQALPNQLAVAYTEQRAPKATGGN